jgi:hypothetical protein
MAFSRPVSEQIERYGNTQGTNTEQLEGVSHGVILAMKEMVSMLEKAAYLWSRGGVGKKVNDGSSGKPASIYSVEWWKCLRASLGIFLVAINTPIPVLVKLVLVDDEGNILLDRAGNPITPFSAASVDDLGGNSYSISDILWIEPSVTSTIVLEPFV